MKNPLGVLVILCASASILQADEDFWGFLKPGTVLFRCAEGSSDQIEAEASWRRLDPLIQALPDDGDAGPHLAAIRELLRNRCLHLAVENGPVDLPVHPTALRRWWIDGGKYWLWSYIRSGQSGRSDDLRSTTSLPPSPRTVLFRETATDSALEPFLCSASDAGCGTETSGWVARAEEALSAERPHRRTWYDDPPEPDPWLRCEAEAVPPLAYERWRACVGGIDERIEALPLGRTRAPREGWLVVVGRRGHYEFCDGVSAFDLATGAAYVAESCSGLALRGDGSVDFTATDALRAVRVRAGRVSVDNLREALWMMALAPHSERVHVRGRDYPVPRGVEIRYTVGAAAEASTTFAGGMWSTGQTQLEWAWIAPSGTVQAEGALLWGSYALDEAHAGELLRVAEGGLVEGCVPATLPALPRRGAGVHSGDASSARIKETFAGIWTALEAYRPVGCAAR
jgi:hypothetical protein